MSTNSSNKATRVLIIYSRDIDINDSGGSRATIQLANYIASKEGYECFCYFRVIEGNEGRIIEVSNQSFTVSSVRECIINNDIDILLVPEAYRYAKFAHRAVTGTKCKIVSALHTMPGYEKISLFPILNDSIINNERLTRKIRALFLLLVYPISYFAYTESIIRQIKKAYTYSDCIVLLSERFHDSFIKEYRIRNGKKLMSISNALSFNNFADDNDIQSKKRQLLVVSRLDESVKRISLILRTWHLLQNKYPDWELLIVGSGRSIKSYRRMIKRLHLVRVELLGHDKPEKYYKDASIFLMTSAYEGWGMTLTEAQQYGCVPIVMDSFSAVYDIIHSGQNGIISPNNDIDSFVSNISFAIENNEQRYMMAKNCIKSSKQFRPENISEKWINLFDSLTGKNKPQKE